MRIARRKILLGSAGVIGVLGLGVWGFGGLGLEAEIVSVLRRRLSFLKLDADGLRAFAKAQVRALFDKRIPTWNRMKYHFQSAVGPAGRYDRSTDTRSKIARAEDTLISTYLLSSDFFWNGSDESRIVRYIAYYDPMDACGNPFARPAVDHPAAT